jgi:YidC/Oxa1 family membrane protein insertase
MLEKRGIDPDTVNIYANMNTRNMGTEKVSRPLSDRANQKTSMSEEKASEKALSSGSAPKPGSLAAKANMVRDYNNRNKK